MRVAVVEVRGVNRLLDVERPGWKSLLSCGGGDWDIRQWLGDHFYNVSATCAARGCSKLIDRDKEDIRKKLSYRNNPAGVWGSKLKISSSQRPY